MPMNVFVLSELHPSNTHVGWSVSYGLHEILATTCNATLLYPVENDNAMLLKQYKVADNRVDFLKRYRHRIFKSWYEVDALPTLGSPPNILLVIGILPRFLLSIFALGPLLGQFDLRVGYLLDGFDPHQLNHPPLKQLDHLFTMSAELAEQVTAIHDLSSSFLPLGIDTTMFGRPKQNRPIDIMSYGRTDRRVHQQLQYYYNQQGEGGDRLYYHSTFSRPEVFSPKEHITLLARLMARAKINLCFEASAVQRFQGYSPISYRWFEGWAAGCAIVGTRPFGQGVNQLLDWQDSTLDIPEQSNDWISFFEDLLNDETRLAEISQRNYWECRLRHDWRYRLQNMFKTLKLPIPQKLAAEIIQLQGSVLKQSTLQSTF
jgi:Glycosyl transferases group 1